MSDSAPSVVLRDSTLREGLDTPGVCFSLPQGLEIAEALGAAGVPEAEVVAPSRVLDDLRLPREMKRAGLAIRSSGLVYANGPDWRRETERAGECLDRLDLLMPLSEHREPRRKQEKIALLLRVLAELRSLPIEVGAGFPHSTQVEEGFLLEIARRAEAEGAGRVTVYDSNGSADPFGTHRLVGRLVAELSVPVWFHGHNDLGLATANSWAAVSAGARGLDVTVNGLGDRAGNASLEQLTLLLRLHGVETGVQASALRGLSRLVEGASGVAVSKLAPVVGEYVFAHESPSHLRIPAEFEAFDPDLIGGSRRIAADEAEPPPSGSPAPSSTSPGGRRSPGSR